MAEVDEELRRRERQPLRVPPNQEFPANAIPGIITPPPSQESNTAFRLGQGLRRTFGAIPNAVRGAVGLVSGLQDAAAEQIQRGPAAEFGRGLFGGQSLTAPPEPTGSRPVITEGETPTGDLQQVAENQRPLAVDVSPVRDVPLRQFIQERPEAFENVSPDALLESPSITREDQTPAEGQISSARSSDLPEAPPGSVEVIRGTRRSTDFFEGPNAGLSIPAGFDEATGRRFAAMRNAGIEANDAFLLMNNQDRTAAELMRAGASRQNAFANATSFIDTPQGRIYVQVDDSGEVGFLQTDQQPILEPKVSKRVTVNTLGNREETPVLLYPNPDLTNGAPDPTNVGAQALNVNPNYDAANQAHQLGTLDLWNFIRRRGGNQDDFEEAFRELTADDFSRFVDEFGVE